MYIDMLIIIVLTILISLILLYLECQKPKNFPPGPKWYPIIGSSLAVHWARERTGMLCQAVQEISQGYKNNGVVGLKVGKDRVVIAMTAASIREMMSNEDLDGRPTGPFYETRTWGTRKGVLLTDGSFWVDQRRFIVRHLKEFGYARRGMVEMIQNEAEHLFKDFQNTVRKQHGQAMITMQNAFGLYILNTLWTMMAGIRYSPENLRLKHLQELLHTLFLRIDMMGCLFSHFPLLRFIAPNFSGYRQFVDIHEMMHKFLGQELENHKHLMKDENEAKDLMGVYLQVLQNPERKESFTEKQLLAICLDMFIAGSETTNKTMDFAMLHLIRNPDVQIKAQTELDAVVGRSRLPELKDRIKYIY